MLRTLGLGLCLAACCTLARAQDKQPDGIEWIKDRNALRSAFGGEDGKPVIFWINTRPGLADKLAKANLGHAEVVRLSKEYRCVLYEPNPKGDMAYEMLKSQGLGEYENKVTFFDPTKIDRSQQPNPQDPASLKKFFKEMKKATLWQTKPDTPAPTLARGMHSILKKLKRLPKKKADEKKPGEKKPDPEPAKNEEHRADPAQKLFEQGAAQEQGGKTYKAYKAYRQAARHKTPFGEKAGAAVKRLRSDPEKSKEIARAEQDEKAGAWLSLGKSFQRNEKWKLAAGYYERILKTYPRSRHAAEARERLEQVKERMKG